jgi:hypothetical protein
MGTRNLCRRANRSRGPSSDGAGLKFTRHTDSEERNLETEGTET